MSYVEEAWASADVDAAYMQALAAALMPSACHDTVAAQSPPSPKILPQLCYAAAGGNLQDAESVTAAWMSLYAALHLLDSVEDQDVTDEPWAQWGIGAAINISTGLIASTAAILCRLEQIGVQSGTAHAISAIVFRAGSR
jgi:hypothetical protein